MIDIDEIDLSTFTDATSAGWSTETDRLLLAGVKGDPAARAAIWPHLERLVQEYAAANQVRWKQELRQRNAEIEALGDSA